MPNTFVAKARGAAWRVADLCHEMRASLEVLKTTMGGAAPLLPEEDRTTIDEVYTLTEELVEVLLEYASNIEALMRGGGS